MKRRPDASSTRVQRGFTLLELMMVIAIAAIVVRIVTVNLFAAIPSNVLDSEAAQLVAKFDWLRSEARLQSKPYTLELDLARNRYRIVLPPEKRMKTTQVERTDFSLGWQELDAAAQFIGYQTAGGPVFRKKPVKVIFDENGFTADQAVFLSYMGDEEMVWSVQLSGISGRSRILRDFEGNEQPLREVNEAAF